MSYVTYSGTEVHSPITSKLPGIRWERAQRSAEPANRSTFVCKPIYVYIYIYFYIKFMRYQIMLAYR